ncbi:DUF1338 domain-containing protein [Bowmanella pacifica]|uniref:2-oxoadipate dioxygenase/decarboxylase n=1 Tax=Bowmanella pacifica TaxID=502051 RepID=A0A917YT75_9ALTE|nr:DUF1338 domain-containing protein [Bowmanella pacifica]GGO65637.1 DUF1338 domain-containing protein [Bowmanella pacifica]
MHNNVETLFANLWQDYVAMTPSALKVHQLLGDGDELINDHVAFRTFNIDKVNLEKLAAHFLALGYEEKGQYNFEQKKLKAKHFEHADDTKPKVFISELLVEEFSAPVQAIIQKMVDAIPADAVNKENFLYSGTHWQVSSEEYQTLLNESEYAAWVSAWGFRANHFTVSLNHLKHYTMLSDVNEKLKEAGFELNTSGGEIKGGPEVHLAQSSTMADKMEVRFSDKSLVIPSCFYEFAQRFPLPDGKLYTGFVAASADKIFESTNVGM